MSVNSQQPLPLGYTTVWLSLGVVTELDIEMDRRNAIEGDDRFPEHYRWRAFSKFLKDRKELSRDLAVELYHLGLSDPDKSLGESMMLAIVSRADCPAEVISAALGSRSKRVQYVAQKKLSSRDAAEGTEISPGGSTA